MKASLLPMRDLLHEVHPLLGELAYCHLISGLTCASLAKAEQFETSPFCRTAERAAREMVSSRKVRVRRWDEPPLP